MTPSELPEPQVQIIQGKAGVVMGATGGLGQAITRELVSNGARVFAQGYRDRTSLAALASLPAVTTAAADVRDAPQVAGLFSAVSDWNDRRLDFLVYCVGVNPSAASAADLSIEDWDDTFAVNVRGAFLALKHGLPLLRQSDAPKVVLISSVFGVETPANRSAYGASKHAITGLIQAVSKEEGARLHINALAPGPAWGENVMHIFAEHAARRQMSVEDYVKERVAKIPAGRFLEPIELARVVTLYCSDHTNYVNGQVIKVTGGASE